MLLGSEGDITAAEVTLVPWLPSDDLSVDSSNGDMMTVGSVSRPHSLEVAEGEEGVPSITQAWMKWASAVVVTIGQVCPGPQHFVQGSTGTRGSCSGAQLVRSTTMVWAARWQEWGSPNLVPRYLQHICRQWGYHGESAHMPEACQRCHRRATGCERWSLEAGGVQSTDQAMVCSPG